MRNSLKTKSVKIRRVWKLKVFKLGLKSFKPIIIKYKSYHTQSPNTDYVLKGDFSFSNLTFFQFLTNLTILEHQRQNKIICENPTQSQFNLI